MEDWYEIYNGHQLVGTLDFLWRTCDDTGLLSAEILVKPVAALGSVDRKTQQERLHYLIGYNLEEKASDRLGELTFTHRKLASPRRHKLKKREDKLYSTEAWTTSSPRPKDLEEQSRSQLHGRLLLSPQQPSTLHRRTLPQLHSETKPLLDPCRGWRACPPAAAGAGMSCNNTGAQEQHSDQWLLFHHTGLLWNESEHRYLEKCWLYILALSC